MVQEAEEPLKMPYLLRLQKSNIYGIINEENTWCLEGYDG